VNSVSSKETIANMNVLQSFVWTFKYFNLYVIWWHLFSNIRQGKKIECEHMRKITSLKFIPKGREEKGKIKKIAAWRHVYLCYSS
jgi:hypothetical protein